MRPKTLGLVIPKFLPVGAVIGDEKQGAICLGSIALAAAEGVGGARVNVFYEEHAPPSISPVEFGADCAVVGFYGHFAVEGG